MGGTSDAAGVDGETSEGRLPATYASERVARGRLRPAPAPADVVVLLESGGPVPPGRV
jgi:hypothetical protein